MGFLQGGLTEADGLLISTPTGGGVRCEHFPTSCSLTRGAWRGLCPQCSPRPLRPFPLTSASTLSVLLASRAIPDTAVGWGRLGFKSWLCLLKSHFLSKSELFSSVNMCTYVCEPLACPGVSSELNKHLLSYRHPHLPHGQLQEVVVSPLQR